LKGITINAAWQARIADKKGSISVGKLGDLVILSKNPLTIDSSELNNVDVMTTISRNRVVYGSYPKQSQIEQIV
jgi:predicted amidohydrolase YtcJ